MPTRIQEELKQERGFRCLEEEVFVGIQIVANRLMEPWARHLKESADLTPVQYNVLRILRGAGTDGLWACEVGERLITRSPDVTRLIDRLEKRGLVRRKRDPEDRRAMRVYITDAGRECLAVLDRNGLALLRADLEAVGAKRLETLRDSLEDVLEVVNRRS